MDYLKSNFEKLCSRSESPIEQMDSSGAVITQSMQEVQYYTDEEGSDSGSVVWNYKQEYETHEDFKAPPPVPQVAVEVENPQNVEPSVKRVTEQCQEDKSQMRTEVTAKEVEVFVEPPKAKQEAAPSPELTPVQPETPKAEATTAKEEDASVSASNEKKEINAEVSNSRTNGLLSAALATPASYSEPPPASKMSMIRSLGCLLSPTRSRKVSKSFRRGRSSKSAKKELPRARKKRASERLGITGWGRNIENDGKGMKSKDEYIAELAELHKQEFKVNRRDLAFTRLLGSGAHGAVHLCRDVTAQDQSKRYAVKVIDFDDCAASCLSEIRHLAAVNSDYVVRFEGLCELVDPDSWSDTTTWVMLEYCSGGSLHDCLVMRKKALSEQQTQVVAGCVSLGLRHLNAAGIMHRDIKPSNIMIGADGRAKLTDFGSSAGTVEPNDTVMGTPMYMSPEAMQMGFPYGPKCDVWSLAITLIELVSGHIPHQEFGLKDAVLKILLKPPPTLQNPENYSKELNDFLAECLVKNPEERKHPNELTDTPYLADVVKDLEGNFENAWILKEIMCSTVA